MPYPERIAVLDSDTPDVEVVYRLYTPDEGPLPQFDGTSSGAQFDVGSYDGSRTSGFSTNTIANDFDPDPPVYVGIGGLSKTGWGVANYLGETTFINTKLGSTTVWTNGHIITTYGGPIRQPAPGGAPFGVWSFAAAVNTELTSFEGGVVSFTPDYEDIEVDWSFSASALDDDVNAPPMYLGYCEAPLSTEIRPASLQFWRFSLPIDPFNLSNKVFGLETAYEASTIEINRLILFDVPEHDTLDLPNYSVRASMFSRDNVDDNWMVGQLYSNDISDTLTVLTRFSSDKPMFPEIGVPGPADFDHYIPLIATESGNLTSESWLDLTCVTDGWLMKLNVGEDQPPQWVLISRDWSTYQRMSFIGGEQAFCDNTTDNHQISYLQDTDSTWLALTCLSGFPYNSDLLMWVEGEMAPGFTGCSIEVPTVPPLPTIVTGDVIIRAWSLSLDGHDMYVLRLGLDQTLVYDKYSKQWYAWSSKDNAIWAVNSGFEWLGGVGIGPTTMVVGDDTTGTLYFLDPEQPYDNPTTEEEPEQQIYFDRIVMGRIPMTGRGVSPCYGIFVTGNLGEPAYEGAGITLYTSDDTGKTWFNHGLIEISETPYSPEAVWTSLGHISAPGRLFMLIDDGAFTRIDSMEMQNE